MARESLYGKFKKAKDASSYDNKAMKEIFGARKGPASSPSSSPSPSPPPMEASITTTTSGVSIRDYFAKKMAAGKAPSSSPSPSPSPTPRHNNSSSGSSGSSDDDAAPPRLEAPTARPSQFQVAGGRGFSEAFQVDSFPNHPSPRLHIHPFIGFLLICINVTNRRITMNK
jgi:hypothetical protein